MTGERPDTCPWRSFQEPLVSDVLRAYGLFESGQMAIWLGADPPNVVVEAVVFYHATVNRVRADRDERERKQREMRRKVMGHG